jgi:hypothetical protein
MIENLNDIRLSDYVFAETKKISYLIENQFPAIYREEGKELVELVKGYYEFLESEENQSIYNARRMYEYRNIDTTLERMLIYFKNKFLSGLFFEEDTRFIVKNILDLYRRKGSKEGIELFFKLFFDAEVEIYYPSEDMLKPSSSQWKVGTFIQLHAVDSIDPFKDIVNKRIIGDKSQAEAFVDSLYFVNIKNSIIPILFLSDVRGEFKGFDVIFSNTPAATYGRVYGSLESVTVTNAPRSDNRVGDIIEIASDTGYGAKGRATKVSNELTGEITFDVVSGGYGYTTLNTDIEISTQSVFFADPDPLIPSDAVSFIVDEKVQQVNSSGTTVTAFVVGRNNTAVGLRLDLSTSEATATPATYFIEGGYNVITIERVDNITVLPVFVTQPNSSASADIGTISDSETITIIVDIIGNYLDVTIDSNSYSETPPALLEMSGSRVNFIVPSLNTRLNEAFVPETFTIGVLSSLTNVDPGTEYFNDAFVIAREDVIKRFNLRDQIVRIIPAAGVIIFEGNILVQSKIVQNFNGTNITTQVRGRVVKVEGNNIYVTQLTFESFIQSEPLYKENGVIPVSISAISKDLNSLPMGLNAKVNGVVQTVIGKLEELVIIDSGFAYQDITTAQLYNLTKRERQNLIPIRPIPASEGGTFGAEILLCVNSDSLKSAELDLFLRTIFYDGFAYGDIDENELFGAPDVLDFEKIAEGTASKSITDRWTNIIVPQLIKTDWYKENIGLFVLLDSRPDAIGITSARGQGLTEGRWISFFSQLNSNKVIQDSFYYQDYSYEINTEVSTIVYEQEYKELMHPAGLQLFTKFGKTDIIDINITIPAPRITDIDLDVAAVYIDDGNVALADSGFQYLIT